MANARSLKKKNLSNNILGMKFMRRSALNIEKDKNDEDNKKIIDDEHWVIDIPELKQKWSEYDVEESYVCCQDLIFGRMSFHNFNPEIQKLADSKIEEKKNVESERREKELEVDEDEMANRYMSLIGTIAKKWKKAQKTQKTQKSKNTDRLEGVQKVKNKKQKHKQFMKPSDD